MSCAFFKQIYVFMLGRLPILYLTPPTSPVKTPQKLTFEVRLIMAFVAFNRPTAK